MDIIKRLDWLLPLFIWLLIFIKNISSKLLFVDYIPSTHFDTIKALYLSNFNYVFNLFDFLKLLFYHLHLLSIVFQISILIAMYVSYFYIKRLYVKKGMIFTLLFAFIYFFNAFVYTRIMAGHLGTLLSYLLMPVFLYYLFNFFKYDLDRKYLIKLVISMAIVSLFAIHFFVINFIIFLVASFYFYFFKNFQLKSWFLRMLRIPNKKPEINLEFGHFKNLGHFKNKYYLKRYLISFGLILLILVLLNIFWIQGLFSSGIFSSIDMNDESFFSPKMSQNIPAVAKIMGMWGFWRESGMITAYSSFPLPIWYIMLSILLIPLIIGFLYPLSKKSLFFFTLFWIGLILGTGISHPFSKPFFDFLFKYIPLFNGFRDSHKLVSLIALSYAYLVPSFLLNIKEKYKRLFPPALVIIIVFFLLFTFPLLGLWNQQKSIDYPKDYYDLGSYISSINITGYIIYLPWQQYLTYNWTSGIFSDGRIPAPINHIIKQSVITGPDEYGSPDLLQRNIKQCLSENDKSCLQNLGIEYIIKDKCAFYPQTYTFLSPPVYENNCLSLYKLNNKQVQINYNPPLRFILGVMISIVTLIVLIYVLFKIKKTNL